MHKSIYTLEKQVHRVIYSNLHIRKFNNITNGVIDNYNSVILLCCQKKPEVIKVLIEFTKHELIYLRYPAKRLGFSIDAAATLVVLVIIRALRSGAIASTWIERSAPEPGFTHRSDFIEAVRTELILVSRALSYDFSDLTTRITLAACENGLLDKHEVRTREQKNGKAQYKVNVFLRHADSARLGGVCVNHGVGTKPFTIWEGYQIGDYYGQCYPLLKKRNDRSFSYQEDLAHINKLVAVPYRINKNHWVSALNNIYFILEKTWPGISQQYAYEEWVTLSVEKQEHIIKKQYRENQINLRKLREERNTVIKRKQWLQKHIIYSTKLSILLNWLPFLKKKLERMEKQAYQKSARYENYILNLNRSLQKNRHILTAIALRRGIPTIYFSYFLDFRGRIYAYAETHPITNKLIRGTIEPKQQTSRLAYKGLEYEALKKTDYYKHLSKINIKKIQKLIKTQHPELGLRGSGGFGNKFFRGSAGSFNKAMYVLALVELGKLNKTALLLKKDGSTDNLTAEHLAAEGYTIFIDPRRALCEYRDIEKVVYLGKLVYEIKKFNELGYWSNFTVNRDSTASAFQHWALVLGVEGTEQLLQLNLSGRYLCDIYIILIKQFIISYNKYRGHPLLQRKYIKRTAMSINYNITRWKSWEYYQEAIIDDYGLEWKTVFCYDEVRQMHNDFYLYVGTEAFSLLYKNKKEVFLSKYLKNQTLEKKMYYYYKIRGNKIKIIQHRGKRWKFQLRDYDKKVCEYRVTKRALPANIIHASDARLAKNLVSVVGCVPIHDSFIFSLSQVGVVMDTTNQFFKAQLGYSYPYGFWVIV